MRKAIWNAVCSKLEAGCILPWWALAVRAVLFPLRTFYWAMSRAEGYQWRSDTWLIEGVEYSGEALARLADSRGRVYRIDRVDGVVTLTEIKQ